MVDLQAYADGGFQVPGLEAWGGADAGVERGAVGQGGGGVGKLGGVGVGGGRGWRAVRVARREVARRPSRGWT